MSYVTRNASAEAGRGSDHLLEPRRSLGLASSRWFCLPSSAAVETMIGSISSPINVQLLQFLVCQQAVLPQRK